MIYIKSIPCPNYYVPEYQSLEDRTKKKVEENSHLPKPTWSDHNSLAPPEIHRCYLHYNGARNCPCGFREGTRLTHSYRLFDGERYQILRGHNSLS